MLQDIFIYATVLGGLVLIVQVGMMFFGLDDLFEGAEGGGDDFSFEADGDGSEGSGFWFFEMLSLKTLSAAAAFFGLGGWLCLAAGQSNTVALIVAVIAGYGALYSVYWAFKQIFKLETSGNLDIRNALGKAGQVYIPIPASRGGNGKVQMKVQDRIVEYQAVTEEAEPLKTGEQVVVVDLVSSDTVVVQREAEPSAI